MPMWVQKLGMVLIRETQYGSDSDVLGTLLLNTDSNIYRRNNHGRDVLQLSHNPFCYEKNYINYSILYLEAISYNK